MQHDATGDVVVPQSLYAQLLRDSEEYAAVLAHRTLPGGQPPGVGGDPAGPVLDVALVERVSLLEIRASVSLRQARLPAAQAGAQGVPPKRLGGVPDAFQGVFHVEPKRLMVFRAGEGTSRLVLQMNFTDGRGLPVDAFLHEGRPRVVVLSDPETGRVAELAMDDAGAADALFAAVALRLHAKEHRAAAAAGGGGGVGDGGARVSPHRSRHEAGTREAVVRMPSSKVRPSPLHHPPPPTSFHPLPSPSPAYTPTHTPTLTHTRTHLHFAHHTHAHTARDARVYTGPGLGLSAFRHMCKPHTFLCVFNVTHPALGTLRPVSWHIYK